MMLTNHQIALRPTETGDGAGSRRNQSVPGKGIPSSRDDGPWHCRRNCRYSWPRKAKGRWNDFPGWGKAWRKRLRAYLNATKSGKIAFQSIELTLSLCTSYTFTRWIRSILSSAGWV